MSILHNTTITRQVFATVCSYRRVEAFVNAASGQQAAEIQYLFVSLYVTISQPVVKVCYPLNWRAFVRAAHQQASSTCLRRSPAHLVLNNHRTNKTTTSSLFLRSLSVTTPVLVCCLASILHASTATSFLPTFDGFAHLHPFIFAHIIRRDPCPTSQRANDAFSLF